MFTFSDSMIDMLSFLISHSSICKRVVSFQAVFILKDFYSRLLNGLLNQILKSSSPYPAKAANVNLH